MFDGDLLINIQKTTLLQIVLIFVLFQGYFQQVC